MRHFGAIEGTRKFLKSILHDEWLGNRTAIVSSFGIEAAVPLALVAEAKASTPVILIDTGYLFGVTRQYRDQLQQHLGLTDVRTSQPLPTQAASLTQRLIRPLAVRLSKKKCSPTH